MYIDRNFDGMPDQGIRDIIENGRLAVFSVGANWDIFEAGGQYYYVAKAEGARSGWFGDPLHFKLWTRREAERLYHFTASENAVSVDLECLIRSLDGEPSFWDCNDLAREHGCEWWSVERFREEGRS